MGCELILKKLRGLNEKCQKLEFFGNCFPKGNPWTESTSPWTSSGAGPRSPSRRRLAGERPERHPRAGNLTAVEGKGRGDGGEPHWLQKGVAEGRTRPGDGGEQSAEEALGGVDVADLKASN
jgi:hypothetical protein